MHQSVSDNTYNPQKLQARIQHLDSLLKNVTETQTAVSDLDKAVACLPKQLDDLEHRSRTNNLLIFGLREDAKKMAADRLALIETPVFYNMEVKPKTIECFHQIGKTQTTTTRPVILKLCDSRKKMEIINNCRKLKGSNISISEDFKKRVQNIKKKLWESAREEQISGDQVRLIEDKLFLDDNQFFSGIRNPTRTVCVVNTSLFVLCSIASGRNEQPFCQWFPTPKPQFSLCFKRKLKTWSRFTCVWSRCSLYYWDVVNRLSQRLLFCSTNNWWFLEISWVTGKECRDLG